MHIFAIFADPRQTEGTCWRTNNPHYDQARVPCVSFRSFCPTYANIVTVDPGSALCASWVSFVSEFKLSTYLLFPPTCAVRKRRLSASPFALPLLARLCRAACAIRSLRLLRVGSVARQAMSPEQLSTLAHASPVNVREPLISAAVLAPLRDQLLMRPGSLGPLAAAGALPRPRMSPAAPRESATTAVTHSMFGRCRAHPRPRQSSCCCKRAQRARPQPDRVTAPARQRANEPPSRLLVCATTRMPPQKPRTR